MPSPSFRTVLCVSVFCCLGTAISSAAQHRGKKAFVDAKSAGADFQVQGEYEGATASGHALGVQVIALGDGKFDAVFYGGGLPGAGWDGKRTISVSGATTDGVTRFTNDRGTAEITDGTLTAVGQRRGEEIRITAKKVLRKSPTLGAKPPSDAVVLFDGSNVDAWQKGPMEEGQLLGVPTRTKEAFGSFRLHLEFRTPFMPTARGQGRGNSGVYLLDQYEVQVLDSFGLSGEDNECGGIYKVAKPLVNMCLPPLSWQTYDIEITRAKFDDQGQKVANAILTVRHNGVVIHDKLELPHATPGGGRNDEKPGPLFLQNHGNPVRYRNIWIVKTQD